MGETQRQAGAGVDNVKENVSCSCKLSITCNCCRSFIAFILVLHKKEEEASLSLKERC